MTCLARWAWTRGATALLLLAAVAAPVRGAPSAEADAYVVRVNSTLEVIAPGVLANDVPGTGVVAALEDGPTHGRLLLFLDGSFIYTPDGGYAGTDTFTYRAADASGRSEPTLVSVAVESWPYPRLLINEVEINPSGTDSDREWVELFNATREPVDLLGWRIAYTYRGPGALPLAETSTLLSPGGYFVFTYPGIRLVNATLARIRLFDPSGLLVDETPALRDEADDEKTWQRFPNGSSPSSPDLWVFREATRGRPLGP